MSTTTAAMLLMIADRRARDLLLTEETVSRTAWETFDHTVHSCLYTLLGPGRRLTGHDSPAAAAAIRAFTEYPSPLKPPSGEVHTPSEAARFLGLSPHHVRKDIVSGALPAQRVDREYRIASECLDRRPDILPADPTDEHPLARLTVALGAMTDLVAGHRASHGAALTDDVEIAAAMRQVLSLTTIAARHTLGHCPVSDADRPLIVAQYATRAVDALESRSNYPQLWTMASSSPPPVLRTPNERLEASLRQWSAAARTHLQFPVPSTDVIRNIANQGVHLMAVTDALIRGREAGGGIRFNTRRGHDLREVATSLGAAETAWAPFTTAMPPSHDYVTASRAAFSALNDISSGIRTDSHRQIHAPEIDCERALLDLAVASRNLATHLDAVEDLPQRLMDSELLFVRARTIAPRADILDARLRGQLVIARPQDAPDLGSSTRAAAELARTVPDGLFDLLSQREAKLTAERVAGEHLHLL